jgi:hypothetical protein
MPDLVITAPQPLRIYLTLTPIYEASIERLWIAGALEVLVFLSGTSGDGVVILDSAPEFEHLPLRSNLTVIQRGGPSPFSSSTALMLGSETNHFSNNTQSNDSGLISKEVLIKMNRRLVVPLRICSPT